MANKVKIGWKKYFELIEVLASIIRKKFIPNQIICIATGGFIPGLVLAKIFDVPLATLAAESYHRSGGRFKDQKGKVVFARDLAKTRPGLGNRVLLIDDLADTGDTLKQSIIWLKRNYGEAIDELKTAVIWHKTKSICRADFFVKEIKADKNGKYPWIIQPIEKYER